MLTILKREILSYFRMPLAYVYLATYLILSLVFVFAIGHFMEANQASLISFFVWQPWLLLFLAPAVGMGLWSEEKRSGTAELLLTLPKSVFALVAGKFLAGWIFLTFSLLCTATLVLMVGLIGNPDFGMIAGGYVGCILLAGCFLAVSAAVSAFSRDQLVCYILSFALCLVLLLIGVRPVLLMIMKWGVPAAAVRVLTDVSLLTAFNSIMYGMLDAGHLVLLGTIIGAALAINCWQLTLLKGSRRISALLAISVAVTALLAFGVILPRYCHLKIDFTCDELYTLSMTSRGICKNLERDAEIVLVYSENYPELGNEFMAFAHRLDIVLAQYAKNSEGGKSRCAYQRINPESEAQEAQMMEQGCIPNIGSMGDSWFCSIVIKSGDNLLVMNEITPKKEGNLEYEISSALLRVTRKQLPKIGIIGNLPLAGMMDSQTGRQYAPWKIYSALKEHFQIIDLGSNPEEIPADLNVLMAVHPSRMIEKTEDRIVSFLKNGGKMLAFCDPLCKAEMTSARQFQAPRASQFKKLFESWNVKFSATGVVADINLATPMISSINGLQMQPTLLNIGSENLNGEYPFLHGIQSIKEFCAGEFELADGNSSVNGVEIIPLAWSTEDSAMLKVYEAQRSATDIRNEMKPDGRKKILAILVQGKLMVDANEDGRVILFGDADLLHDSLCMEARGTEENETADTLLSDNIAFVLNAIEYLAGSESLAGIRSKVGMNRQLNAIKQLAGDTQKNIQNVMNETQLSEQKIKMQLSMLQQDEAQMSDERKSENAVERGKLLEELSDLKEEMYRRQRGELKKMRSKIDDMESRMILLNLILPVIVSLFGLFVAWRRNRN